MRAVSSDTNDSFGQSYLIVLALRRRLQVCLLFEDHVPASCLLAELFGRFAAKFPDIKCVKIKSQSAVENFPERNVPALFAYRDGELQHQVSGWGG